MTVLSVLSYLRTQSAGDAAAAAADNDVDDDDDYELFQRKTEHHSNGISS